MVVGKHFFSAEAHTPADNIREALGEAERLVATLRETGPQIVQLLHLLDQVAEGLDELELGGMDVRVERSRFETVQAQLGRRKGRFLARAGGAFGEAREAVQLDRAHWWWSIDEACRREKKQRLRRWLIVGAVVVSLLAVVALVNELFAPPPEVRKASRLGFRGESLVRDDGDLKAALVEFEAAAALDPANPDYLVWIGVLQSELGDAQAADEAFDAARSLYETDLGFFLARAGAYRDVSNLDAATADVEQAIIEYPESGWVYYMKHLISLDRRDYATALDDLDKAEELAQKSGDVQLEAQVRMQRAMVLQMPPMSPEPTPMP
ncbi:MAG: tetratricopeptide repeat protein [Anaerolineae bacterium]